VLAPGTSHRKPDYVIWLYLAGQPNHPLSVPWQSIRGLIYDEWGRNQRGGHPRTQQQQTPQVKWSGHHLPPHRHGAGASVWSR
jgi:hypothetical protein